MTTPLQLLREYTVKGYEVQIRDEQVVFPAHDDHKETTFNKTTPTSFYGKTTKKCYDLFSIYTCLKYANLSFGEYVGKCKADEATMVSTVDKRELLAYLRGEKETSAQIKFESVEENKPNQREEAIHQIKKQKVDDSKDKQLDVGKEDVIMEDAGSNELVAADNMIHRIQTREVSYKTRDSILNTAKRTFTHVLRLFEQDRVNERDRKSKSKANTLSPTKPMKKVENAPLSKYLGKLSGPPIIVVPAGSTDIFSMLNIKDFICNGRYISTREKKAAGTKKEHSMVIHHKIKGETLSFRIVDNVTRYDIDWRCVTCVIVAGPKWQFKGWKYKFPVELFEKVLGIYFHFQGSDVKPDVKSWSVKVLQINKDKRHLDAVAVKKFWDELYAFMQRKFR